MAHGKGEPERGQGDDFVSQLDMHTAHMMKHIQLCSSPAETCPFDKGFPHMSRDMDKGRGNGPMNTSFGNMAYEGMVQEQQEQTRLIPRLAPMRAQANDNPSNVCEVSGTSTLSAKKYSRHTCCRPECVVLHVRVKNMRLSPRLVLVSEGAPNTEEAVMGR